MHLAFLCPPFTGHLNPMFALGSALKQRGHRVSFVAIEDASAHIVAAGFGCEVVGGPSHPRGTLARLERALTALRGLYGIRKVIADVAGMTDMLCREAPAALGRIEPDGIVCDQLEPAGGLLARRFGLRYVSVANALMLNREPYVPPPFTDWAYERTRWARERNLGGYRVSDWLMGRVSAVIAHWSAAFGLPRVERAEQCLSTRQIGQLSSDLDFPREALAEGFAYTGPLRGPRDDDARWQPPAGARGPFAFVSLGSLQGGRFALIARMTQACRDLGLTAVVAHNGRLSEAQVAALPGEPIVEPYLPQRRVIERCALVVTHGGMNTVLDALVLGVPLALVPLAMEQGAIARRVVRVGAGAQRQGPSTSVASLRQLMHRVLHDTAFRSRANDVASSLKAAGGATRAAELVERHVA